jgi:arsenical pump membrane protein
VAHGRAVRRRRDGVPVLDTTAVLLTPVVVASPANGLPPLPFAFATVWLANTASLFLPVSNLTNLLAAHRLGDLDAARLPGCWARRRSSRRSSRSCCGSSNRRACAVGSTAERRASPTRAAADLGRRARRHDAASGHRHPAVDAGTGAASSRSSRGALQAAALALVPWQLVVFASGLFLAVGAAELGSGAFLAAATGSGEDLVSLWQVAGVGMLGANVVNNLPAYLALESAAGSPCASPRCSSA